MREVEKITCSLKSGGRLIIETNLKLFKIALSIFCTRPKSRRFDAWNHTIFLRYKSID